MNANHSDTPRNRRAAQVRQRKTQPDKQPFPSAAHPARHTPFESTAQARPVLMRNGAYGTPVRQRIATTNPRKQYYVPLGAPGTELRLPALPRFGFGARAISGILALGTLITIFSMLFSPLFSVQSARVSGLKRMTQANIEAVLNIQNLSIIELDPQALRTDLLAAYPILESATVSVGLPNLLKISVTERQPVLDWKVGEKSLWVDEKGVIFQPSGDAPEIMTIAADAQPPLFITPEMQKALTESAQTASAGAVVPAALNKDIISGQRNPQLTASADRIDPVLLATARKLATQLPAGTPLTYTAASGLGWKDAGGWEVYIGNNLDQYNQKIALYQSILSQLTEQGITPALISVEFLNSPYYRLEK